MYKKDPSSCLCTVCPYDQLHKTLLISPSQYVGVIKILLKIPNCIQTAILAGITIMI